MYVQDVLWMPSTNSHAVYGLCVRRVCQLSWNENKHDQLVHVEHWLCWQLDTSTSECRCEAQWVWGRWRGKLKWGEGWRDIRKKQARMRQRERERERGEKAIAYHRRAPWFKNATHTTSISSTFSACSWAHRKISRQMKHINETRAIKKKRERERD